MTLAATQAGLFHLIGPKLKLVDIVATGDVVPELGHPIGMAIWDVGGSVADYPTITDDDVATIPTADIPRFWEILTIRGLRFVVSRWKDPNQTAGNENRQELGKFYESIMDEIDRREKALAIRYPGADSGTPGDSGGAAWASIGLGYIADC